MAAFFETLLANALVATVLAALVGLLRCFRLRPIVLHVLWLIVLLKFVTPPLVRLDLPLGGPWSLDGSMAAKQDGAQGQNETTPPDAAKNSAKLLADSAIDVDPNTTS